MIELSLRTTVACLLPDCNDEQRLFVFSVPNLLSPLNESSFSSSGALQRLHLTSYNVDKVLSHQNSSTSRHECLHLCGPKVLSAVFCFCFLFFSFCSINHDTAKVHRPRIAAGASSAISHFHNENQ